MQQREQGSNKPTRKRNLSFHGTLSLIHQDFFFFPVRTAARLLVVLQRFSPVSRGFMISACTAASRAGRNDHTAPVTVNCF